MACTSEDVNTVDTPQHKTVPAYGGTVELRNDIYTMNSKSTQCTLVKPKCSKALVSTGQHKPSTHVTNYTMYLTINKLNLDDPPEWWVFFQDWTRIGNDPAVGNRPISTLELLVVGDRVSLRHKDASYQFPNSTRIKQVNNGEVLIEVGVEYYVEFIIADKGWASLIVNGQTISYSEYQTKSLHNWEQSVIEFGIYHNEGYNDELDPLKQINVSVRDFKISK